FLQALIECLAKAFRIGADIQQRNNSRVQGGNITLPLLRLFIRSVAFKPSVFPCSVIVAYWSLATQQSE
ncbi:MAG: hypothetical protein ABIQ99_01150, partial [Thermoflexales bacterium]